MIDRLKLAYLVLEVRRVNAWQGFMAEILGLPAAHTNADGSLGYRLDRAAQRLVLQPGRADDVAAIGLELADEGSLAELRERLAGAGVRTAEADRAACKARRVRRLVAFHDPDGNRLEAVLGMESALEPFTSPCFAGPFGNATGFGHAVLAPRDLAASEAFYAGTLGFGISERLCARVGPLEVQGVFLHCNRRHHSLALMALPQRKKLHHFMLEASSMADVVRAHERARAHRVPLSLSLGQHPDPDGTLSFYGRTPSGFDFEIGAGGREIQPLGWRPLAATSTSSWGHKPTLGLQLRAARGLLAARLGL